VDVKHAADLYADGLTLAEVAAEVGVSTFTVRDLLAAGVPLRPRGARASSGPPPAPTPRRYPDRARPRPWREILLDALAQQPVISVRLTVAGYLRRKPTRAETNASRRAAHGLAADGQATVLRVKTLDAGPGSANLILALPGTSSKNRSKLLAEQAADARTVEAERFDATAIAQDLARSVELLVGAVEAIPTVQLDQAAAGQLAASVDASLEDLRRVRRQLKTGSEPRA